MHFAIFIIWFRIFSPFYIYLTLPYPHKKNRREIRSPHHLGLLRLYCDFTATAFPLRLRLTPHTAASSYRPSTHYRIFYRIFYCISIASHHTPHIIASHIETVYWKGLPGPRTFYIDLSVVFVLIIFRSYRHCGRIILEPTARVGFSKFPGSLRTF